MFEIDPDIRRAKTLVSDFYTDERYFEISKEKIFARSWQFLGRSDDLARLKPVHLLPGILDEPVLLVKTGKSVKCLTNVCTHRGKILVEEPCDANLIRCGYHGRRFSLDGKMLSMPEFEGVENFPCESDDLKQLPVATLGGFVFASTDPAADFEVFAGEVAAIFDEDAYHPEYMKLTAKRVYEVNAHWALYCENYLEGFHVPYVHPSLNSVIDYGTYTTDTFRYSSVQTAYEEAAKHSLLEPFDRQNATPGIAGRYAFIFPNLMFNFYPWGISVNIVRPVSCDKTLVEFLTYVGDEMLVDEGAGADLHKIEMEDEAVVQSVQKGIQSRFYSQGRYSPNREQGTHHFHRLIAEFMNV